MNRSTPADLNDNGIADEIEPPPVDISAGSKQLADRLQDNPGTDPTLSGGDIDARREDAESGGDETVGGSTATPGRNDLDEIGEAMGVGYADGAGNRERDGNDRFARAVNWHPRTTMMSGDSPQGSRICEPAL